jgi:hypothetical protein
VLYTPFVADGIEVEAPPNPAHGPWRRVSARAAAGDVRLIYGDSDLDQVVAAEHLEFKQFQGNSVRVSGWPDEPTEQKKAEWVATYSDHALLYFVVQKV